MIECKQKWTVNWSIDSTNLTNIYYAPIIGQALCSWLEYKISALNEFLLGQGTCEDIRYKKVVKCWGIENAGGRVE